MIKASYWERILQIIHNGNKFILTTHINPDGDAIGSEIALAKFLVNRNKQVSIINISPTSTNYKFLDPQDEILVFDQHNHSHLISNADAVLIVDISDWKRLGKLGSSIKQSTAIKICIDHHHLEEKFADIDIICEDACSTGELIYEFLTFAKCKINDKIAEALYTCILTDTGSFRFSNTTALTHQIASQLISAGVNATEIYQQVYERNSQSKILLMGKALNEIKYECDGKLAWFYITQKMFQEAKAQKWDTEGFPEIPRTIDGVEVSLMFTELEDKNVKISLRSKGKIVINKVATKFGGGGHNFAAGAVIEKPLKETIPLVLEETKKTIWAYSS